MLSLELKPAWQLAVLLFFIHIGAMICIFPLWLIWPIKIILLILCGVSLIFTMRHYVLLRSPKSILKISQHSDGEWRLYNYNNDEIRATLHGSSVKTPFFMLLNFSNLDQRGFYKIIIIPNANIASDFRRLQIALFH